MARHQFSISVEMVDEDEPDLMLIAFSLGSPELKYMGTIEAMHSVPSHQWVISNAAVDVNGTTVWEAEGWDSSLKDHKQLCQEVSAFYSAIRVGVLQSLSYAEWQEEWERR